MATSAPDWLKSRDGDVKPSRDGHTLSVMLGGQPQYLIEPLPAKGKFGCRVLQTINGKRLEGNTVYGTKDEAFQGGLEDLRNALGW